MRMGVVTMAVAAPGGSPHLVLPWVRVDTVPGGGQSHLNPAMQNRGVITRGQPRGGTAQA